jgi:archaellum biogenesis protein FlaJ (TadC family)
MASCRVGPFALACLHIARVAALINVLLVLVAGGGLALNGHYFVAALLVLFGVPISIGHFVAFGLLIDYAHTS